MDTTSQANTVPLAPQDQSLPPQPPAPPPVPIAPAPVAAPSPVSVEHEPTPVVPQASVPEHEELKIPKEVEGHMEQQPEVIDVPPDLVKVGVQVPAQDLPATSLQPPTVLSIPLTDDQIGEGLEQKQSMSLRWLAEWCLKQLKRVHVHLKKIHGHFVEVKE